MTLNQRRVLYTAFILLFFTLTPAVSFYAAGYNFDWQTGAIQRTGIIIVETVPRGAVVSLANRLDAQYNWLYDIVYSDVVLETPEKIRNLLPGEYEVRLEKEGYLPYERVVRLNGGETIVLSDIPLFRKPEPQAVITQPVLAVATAPNNRRLAALTADTLHIIETGSQRQVTGSAVTTDRIAFDSLAWSAGGSRILQAEGDFAVYNADTARQEFSLAQLLGRPVQLAQWDAGSDIVLYTLAGSTLYRIDANTQLIEPVVPDIAGVQAIAGRDGTIYAVTREQGTTALHLYQRNNAVPFKTIVLPASTAHHVRLVDDTVYVHDVSRQMLYLIKPDAFVPLYAALAGVEDFSVAGDTITYWNRFELWRYRPTAEEKTLIARLSSSIRQGVPYADDRYLVYVTDAGISLAELQDGRYRASFPLLGWNNVSRFVLNRAGTAAYIVSPYEDHTGLYRMELR